MNSEKPPQTVKQIFANTKGKYKDPVFGTYIECMKIYYESCDNFESKYLNFKAVYEAIPDQYKVSCIYTEVWDYDNLEGIEIYIERPLNDIEKLFYKDKANEQRKNDIQKARTILEKYDISIKDPYDYGNLDISG